MDRRALLMCMLATGLGVGLLRLYMLRFEREVSGGPREQVLVVVKDLPAGATLSREALGTRELPEAYLESRHVGAHDLDKVDGALLAVPARANEALLWTDLASMRQVPRRLSSLVPEGMRAISVALRESAAGTLLAPGDRVDLVLAASLELGGEASTETVGQNLLVLAVGDDLGDASGTRSRRAHRASAATLSVTPSEAARIAEAEKRGALELLVRNPDDITTTSEVAQPKAAQHVAAANARRE